MSASDTFQAIIPGAAAGLSAKTANFTIAANNNWNTAVANWDDIGTSVDPTTHDLRLPKGKLYVAEWQPNAVTGPTVTTPAQPTIRYLHTILSAFFVEHGTIQGSVEVQEQIITFAPASTPGLAFTTPVDPAAARAVFDALEDIGPAFGIPSLNGWYGLLAAPKLTGLYIPLAGGASGPIIAGNVTAPNGTVNLIQLN